MAKTYLQILFENFKNKNIECKKYGNNYRYNFYDINGNYEFSYTFENAKSRIELLKHYVNDYMWN